MRHRFKGNIHHLLGFLELRNSTEAPDSLEGRDRCWLDGVGILKSFDSICVCPSSHQQIARIYMYHRILRIGEYESLEVKESQIVVSDQISTFSTVDIALLYCFVEVEGYREVFHGFREDAETSVASATCQEEVSRRLLLFFDSHIEILQSVIEPVHLEFQEASEEVETWFFLFLVTILNGFVHELLGF